MNEKPARKSIWYLIFLSRFCCPILEIADCPGRMISKIYKSEKEMEEKKSERVFKRYLCEI